MSIRTEILAAIDVVVGNNRAKAFSIADIVATMEKQGSAYKRPSIRVYVASKLCGPEGAAPLPDRILDRVGKGKYQLRKA